MVNEPDRVFLTGRGRGGIGRQLTGQGGMIMPSMMQARAHAQRASCLNNLRQIDGAKEQWALVANQPEGAEPTPEQLSEYIKGGFANIRCPQRGTYSINAVGEKPTCTHPGHALR